MTPQELYAEFYGRVTGCCRGKGGSMHPAAPGLGVPGTTAIVGGSIPLAAGAALASQMRGDGRVSVAFFGDGASEQGAFHESYELCGSKETSRACLCVKIIITPPIPPYLPGNLIRISIGGRQATAYRGSRLDGNDVLAVYQAAQEAVARARGGEGPTLLECKTYRWKGHVGPDCDWEKGCRPREELTDWMDRCPIESLRERLIAWGVIDQEWYRPAAGRDRCQARPGPPVRPGKRFPRP